VELNHRHADFQTPRKPTASNLNQLRPVIFLDFPQRPVGRGWGGLGRVGCVLVARASLCQRPRLTHSRLWRLSAVWKASEPATHRCGPAAVQFEPVTILQHIERRLLNLLLNVFVLFLALQLLGFLVQLWPQVFAAVPWFYGFAALVLWAVMAGFAIKLLRIPCPRCSKSLGGAGLAVAIGIPTDSRCPHCHVSSNESVEAAFRGRRPHIT
jgi:hypothetical protein